MSKENVAEQQELEFETEVDVKEETEEAPQEAEAEAQTEEKEASNDDELSEYSKNVQDRIRKITQKYRKEESERKAAIEYAEAVQKQNKELKERLESLDQSYVGEFGTRIDSQIQAAKAAYQKAYDEGNADEMFEAQKNLSKLALDQAQLEQSKKQMEKRAKQAEEAPQQPAQAPQQQAEPDPKAEAWAEKNDWFGTDQPMTYAAFGVHRQLIEDEGFDPRSDEYYKELDRRIRTEFPHKFSDTQKSSSPRVASADSSASRAPSKGKRKVKLTPSQIAIAKRLNVPLEEYAKYVKD
jgi:chromosome segregation ATPase|tara:strand:+ start:609 stop:1496 length:888 start_codon:yes stop_codon:yes gene_type:complete